MPAEDHVLSTAAVVVSALLGLGMIGRTPDAPRIDPPPSAETTFEQRVNALAEAIAASEGYYARGDHDGRSLPYRLNNPGSMTKPALDAASLPTWKETDLVIFPSAAMGWAALRHQVRLMLTGTSGIYHPSDTLVHVGVKYADGDRNWGGNVAAHLGIDPAATLAELAPPGDR